MKIPDAEHMLVSGISAPAAGLRSWTAAGLTEKHAAIMAMQGIAINRIPVQ